MKTITGFVLGLLCALALSAVAAPSLAPKAFHVGVGKVRLGPNGRPLLGATTNAGALTVSRYAVSVNADQSTTITLKYDGANQGEHMRSIVIDAACVAAVNDQYGNQLAASPPATLCTAIASFKAQIDTTIGNAAAANKLNL